MNDERNASWWDEQSAFMYLLKQQTQKKGKPYSSHLREKTEEPEYEQSRANMITKPSKLCLTQRCEEKKNKKYKVKMLIRVIPDSSSEDDTTYFLLKPFSDP